jgi:hypothetical protein
MDSLLKKFEEAHGYKPSVYDLHALYTSGSLNLTDSEENSLLAYFEQNLY